MLITVVKGWLGMRHKTTLLTNFKLLLCHFNNWMITRVIIDFTFTQVNQNIHKHNWNIALDDIFPEKTMSIQINKLTYFPNPTKAPTTIHFLWYIFISYSSGAFQGMISCSSCCTAHNETSSCPSVCPGVAPGSPSG